MSQKKHKNFWIICKEHFVFSIFLILVSGITLMPFVMSIVFDSRYSNEFAKTHLENLGFSQVKILKKHSMTNHISLFAVTTENWFGFRATKENKIFEGKLICYRYFEDLDKGRCEIGFLGDEF